MLPKPAAPLPASELPDDLTRYFRIRPVEIIFRPRNGSDRTIKAFDSRVLFAALREAATERHRVIHFSCDGLDLDAESVAALNCFLRAGLAMGRMHHPWDRLPHAGLDTRYEWSELSDHLGLVFR